MTTPRLTLAQDPQTGEVAVLATVRGVEWELQVFHPCRKGCRCQACWNAVVSEAAAYMRSWIEQRGYQWARDTARRLDAAQRSGVLIVTLDTERASAPA